MTNEQERFIELYSFEQKIYAEIEQEMDIDRKRVQELYKEIENDRVYIQKIRQKFTSARKKEFHDFKEFYNWYKEQKQECEYCGITQEELSRLFDKEKRVLPLNDKEKRASGTLEIERKDSINNKYSTENIILACPLCNNAKSNLIDEENWREIFVPSMKKYYAKLLNS